jgi:hypothetical protein
MIKFVLEREVWELVCPMAFGVCSNREALVIINYANAKITNTMLQDRLYIAFAIMIMAIKGQDNPLHCSC